VPLLAAGLAFFQPDIRRAIGLDRPAQVAAPAPTLLKQPAQTEAPTSTKPEVKQRSKNNVKGNNNVTGNIIAGRGTVVGNNNQVTTAPPVVNNAPGGIINNGGVMTNPTVNNFRPPPRHLTAEQQLRVSEAAKVTPTDVIVWAVGGDNEVWDFGADICKALKQAGWRVENGGVQAMIPGGPLYSDLAVFVNPDDGQSIAEGQIHLNNQAAYNLVTQLRLLNFSVGISVSEKVPKGTVKIVLGPPK